jgi:DNA-binding NarL/FixJ family response regulator
MRIIIVDPQVLFREGLSSLLNNQPDIEVIDEIGSINGAYNRVIESQPDILLIDIGPRIDEGVNAIRTIHSHQPLIKVIILANEISDELLVNSLRSGAKGYLLKNTKFEDILSAIKSVECGEAALSRKMTRRLLDGLSDQDHHDDLDYSSIHKLTKREYEVFGLLTLGLSNQQIAEELFISENTVKIHVNKVLNKLNLRSRRETTKFVYLRGMESPGSSNADE